MDTLQRIIDLLHEAIHGEDEDVFTGIQLELSGDELADHLTARADHHKEKVERYTERIEMLKEDQETAGEEHVTGNPIPDQEDRRRQHRQKAFYFTFLADHVVADKTYRLTERRMRELEITDRYL